MSIATIIIGAVVAIAAYALGHYSGENRGKATDDGDALAKIAHAEDVLARAESTAPKEVLP